MLFILTPAGEQALQASASPPVLGTFTCGSNFGYAPNIAQVGVTGTIVATGQPSEAVVQSANLLKYVVNLDATVGDFEFGEVALHLPGGGLFAIGVSSTPIRKLKNAGTQVGNSLAIDCYISTAGATFSIFAELGNSENELSLQALSNVDVLPRATSAYPNIYQVASPDGSGSLIAFSNNAKWSLTGYEERIYTDLNVSSFTATSVQVSTPAQGPGYPGELVLQWTTGRLLGITRVISGYASATRTFTFNTPLSELPQAGDKVEVLKKTALRPHVAQILAELSDQLASGDINALIDNPLSSFIKRDGSRSMMAPFNVGGYRVTQMSDPILDTDGANKKYVDTTLSVTSSLISSLSDAVSTFASGYFRRDGSIPMSGILNFGNNRATNLASPVGPLDAVNLTYLQNVVDGLTSSIVSNHLNLTGVQGGTSGQHFHLNQAEHSFLTNLASEGLPNAGYGQLGLTSYASSSQVGDGVVGNMTITPESLLQAVSNSGAPNALQSALVAASNAFQTFVQFGSGSPSGSTAGVPPLYFDISTNPHRIWVFRGGTWQSVTAQVVQHGTGAPVIGTTPSNPSLYVDINTFPFTTYVFHNNTWTKTAGEYSQFGSGAPQNGVTPNEPSIYFDVSASPMKMYTRRLGSWFKVGDDSAAQTHAKLYFFAQL